MDNFRGELDYSLPLLIGFDLVEVDHGGRLSAMGGVGPLVVVEGDPPANLGLRLRAGLPGMQLDALILQGLPEAFDEDIVETPALSVSDYIGARALVSGLPKVKWLLGDRGYDADWFREALQDKKIRPGIPGRQKRKTPVRYPS